MGVQGVTAKPLTDQLCAAEEKLIKSSTKSTKNININIFYLKIKN